VDDLPTSVRWIIVFVVGLSPILSVWIAGALGRYVRRKLRSRIGSGPLRSPPTSLNPAGSPPLRR
jgi:hypothetical protein